MSVDNASQLLPWEPESREDAFCMRKVLGKIVFYWHRVQEKVPFYTSKTSETKQNKEEKSHLALMSLLGLLLTRLSLVLASKEVFTSIMPIISEL